MPNGEDNSATWIVAAIGALSTFAAAVIAYFAKSKKSDQDFQTAGGGYKQLYEDMRKHIGLLEQREDDCAKDLAAQRKEREEDRKIVSALEHTVANLMARVDVAESEARERECVIERLEHLTELYEKSVTRLEDKIRELEGRSSTDIPSDRAITPLLGTPTNLPAVRSPNVPITPRRKP